VETFNLITGVLTGYRGESPGKLIEAVCECVDQYDQDALVLGYGNGSLRVVDFETLQVVSKFGNKSHGPITAIASSAKGVVYAGYKSGVVVVLDFANGSEYVLDI
jgi:hypothetical protein